MNTKSVSMADVSLPHLTVTTKPQETPESAFKAYFGRFFIN